LFGSLFCYTQTGANEKAMRMKSLDIWLFKTTPLKGLSGTFLEDSWLKDMADIMTLGELPLASITPM
jgi:hypothetical protein